MLIGEIFGDYVEHLAAHKADQMVIQKEVNETPDLLRGARRAVAGGAVKETDVSVILCAGPRYKVNELRW